MHYLLLVPFFFSPNVLATSADCRESIEKTETVKATPPANIKPTMSCRMMDIKIQTGYLPSRTELILYLQQCGDLAYYVFLGLKTD